MAGWMRSAAVGAVMIALGAMHAGAQDFVVHPISATGYSSPHAVDMNGDGRLDIVASKDLQFIVWYDFVGPGPSNFVEHVVYERPNSTTWLQTPDVADINGDGAVDIALSYQDFVGNDGVFWLRSDGGDPPAFDRLEIGQTEGVNPTWLLDVDNDGDVDLLSRSSSEDTVRYWQNMNADGLTWVSSVIVPDNNGLVRNFLQLDFDQDGDDDLVYMSEYPHEIRWLERLPGPELFAAPQVIAAPAGHIFFGDFISADLNGDGRADLIPGYSSNPSHWWENTGGQLVSHSLDTIGRVGRVVGDLDGDGELDLVGCTSRNEQYDVRVHWQQNLGGAAAWEDYVITPDDLRPTALADLDQDGDLDIVAVGYPIQVVGGLYWIENRLNEPSQNLPGDLTGDCVVGFSDLNIVVGTFGQSGAGVLGDADGDQVVGFSDLNIVLVQFGQSCE